VLLLGVDLRQRIQLVHSFWKWALVNRL
jgi:hypothetical protein